MVHNLSTETDGDVVVNAKSPGIIDAVQSANAQQPPPSAPWSVEAVLKNAPTYSSPTLSKDSTIPFLHILERLKTTKREGWRRFGISSGESIADHMYRMSIITMLCPASLSSRLNIPHCTKMALIHDMAESLVGDITPVDGVSKPEKARRERETMQHLGGHLLGSYEGGIRGQELKNIWEEYEAGQTLESVFVHDVDKLELVLQMVEYERRGEGKLDLSEFAWVAQRIQLEEMKAWCKEVLDEREEMWRKFQPTAN